MTTNELPSNTSPALTDTAIQNLADGTLTQKVTWQKVSDLFNASSNTVRTMSITLTSAQILDSFNTPIELIAAPGSGYAIDVFSLLWRLNYNSIPYATNVQGNVITDTAATLGTSSQWLVGLNNSSNIFTEAVRTGSNAIKIIENKSIKFQTTTGNPVNGNSTITLYGLYRIITL